MASGAHPRSTSEIDLHHPIGRCSSAQEARHRLERLLESLGGSVVPEYEPGLHSQQRADEDELRTVIEYLRSIE